MTRTALVLAALAVPSFAHALEAGESNDEIVTFSGDERLFKGIEEAWGFDLFDEAVSLKATADTSTDISFIMEGKSSLEWPEALSNSWEHTEQGGQIVLSNRAKLAITIRGEIAGFELGYELWSEEVRWEDTFELRSLLLEGTPQGRTATLASLGDSILEFEEEVTLSEDWGAYATIGGRVVPSLDAIVTANAIEVGDESVTSTDGSLLVEVPDVNEGYVDFEALWTGDVQGTMGITVIPTITLTVDSFVFGPLEYPLPIEVFSDTVGLDSDYEPVSHDLPAIEPGARTLDFGQVTVGDSSTRQFVVRNIGNVELAGEARVEGDGFVMPVEALLVARDNEGPATEQILEVDFLPEAAGNFTGTLVLETNDPVTPELIIPMAGAGVNPSSDPGDDPDGDPNDDGDGQLVRQPGSGCGCDSTTPAGGFAALGLLGLLGLVARRRR